MINGQQIQSPPQRTTFFPTTLVSIFYLSSKIDIFINIITNLRIPR